MSPIPLGLGVPAACADIPYFGVRNSVSTRFMEESPRRG